MSETKEQQNQQQRKPGSRRRRRRPRRRQGAPTGPPIEVQGYLWVRDNGSPLMVSAKHNFVAQRSDPTVPAEIRENTTFNVSDVQLLCRHLRDLQILNVAVNET